MVDRLAEGRLWPSDDDDGGDGDEVDGHRWELLGVVRIDVVLAAHRHRQAHIAAGQENSQETNGKCFDNNPCVAWARSRSGNQEEMSLIVICMLFEP